MSATTALAAATLADGAAHQQTHPEAASALVFTPRSVRRLEGCATITEFTTTPAFDVLEQSESGYGPHARKLRMTLERHVVKNQGRATAVTETS